VSYGQNSKLGVAHAGAEAPPPLRAQSKHTRGKRGGSEATLSNLPHFFLRSDLPE